MCRVRYTQFFLRSIILILPGITVICSVLSPSYIGEAEIEWDKELLDKNKVKSSPNKTFKILRVHYSQGLPLIKIYCRYACVAIP